MDNRKNEKPTCALVQQINSVDPERQSLPTGITELMDTAADHLGLVPEGQFEQVQAVPSVGQMDLDPTGQEGYIPTDEEEALLSSPKEDKTRNERAIPERQSGSKRKRMKFYLSKGLSQSDAKRLAEFPMSVGKKEMSELLQGAKKRDRSDTSITTPPHNTPKRIAGPPDARSDAKVQQTHVVAAKADGPVAKKKSASSSDGIKLGILPPDFPQNMWSTAQLSSLQEAILARVRQLKMGAIKPNFNGCTFRPGWLAVNCANQATVEWLKGNVDALKPWKDAKLKIVDDKEVPRPQIFIGYFPEKSTASNDAITSLIQGQNEGLRVGDWRLLNRAHKGATVELTFAVDPISAKAIVDRGYTVFYGFGCAKFRPKNRQRPTEEENASGASNEQPCCSKDAQAATSRIVSAFGGVAPQTAPKSSTPAVGAKKTMPSTRPRVNQNPRRKYGGTTAEERIIADGRCGKVARRAHKVRNDRPPQ